MNKLRILVVAAVLSLLAGASPALAQHHGGGGWHGGGWHGGGYHGGGGGHGGAHHH